MNIKVKNIGKESLNIKIDPKKTIQELINVVKSDLKILNDIYLFHNFEQLELSKKID